jgi:hypothetical protein
MLRETIQTLACLCVLTSTYSLHMSRDLVDFGDTDDQLERPIPIDGGPPQSASITNKNSIVYANNLLDDSSLNDWNHPVGPVHYQPRGLQDLFGVVVTNYDFKAAQLQHNSKLDATKAKVQPQPQQQKKASAQLKQPHLNSKRASTSGNSGAGPGGGSNSGSNSGSGSMPNMPNVPHGMASQLMLRSARGQRQYDVPQIGEYTLSGPYTVHNYRLQIELLFSLHSKATP